MLVEALIIIAGILVIAAAFRLAAWEEFDDRRRSERLVHRNLERMMGR